MKKTLFWSELSELQIGSVRSKCNSNTYNKAEKYSKN